MKHLFKSLFFVVFFLLCSKAVAYDCYLNGIYYNLNNATKTASVTYLNTGSWNEKAYKGSVTIPSSFYYNGYYYLVTSIGNSAFTFCTDLTSVLIPNSVTSIEETAFYDCISLTSIVLPNSVTTIGKRAFDCCFNLTSVVIPKSLTNIESDAFSNCSSLQKVNIDDISAWCRIDFANSSSNPLYYANHLYLNNQLLTNFVIPNTITKIKKYAFYNAKDFKSVTLPNTVTSIDVAAFSGCSGLTSIDIPSSVTSIGGGAFSSCSSLQKVNVDDIGAWCNIDFKSESGIDYTANPLYYARHLYLDNQLVTNIVIPNSITKIRQFTFYNAKDIKSIIIPSSVINIERFAFSNCSGLTDITIPFSVLEIGQEAFRGCTSLSDITSEITDVFVTGTDAFKGCENATLHVPAGTYVAYSGRADWNRIIHIEEAAPAEEGFQMTLACNTKGSVLVNGKTTFTNKIKDVEVNEEEENTFEFIPNEGCRLEQVTLNGLDVTLSVNNNKLTAMIPAKSQMMVVFSKSNDINGDGNVDISDVVSLVNFILGQ